MRARKREDFKVLLLLREAFAYNHVFLRVLSFLFLTRDDLAFLSSLSGKPDGRAPMILGRARHLSGVIEASPVSELHLFSLLFSYLCCVKQFFSPERDSWTHSRRWFLEMCHRQFLLSDAGVSHHLRHSVAVCFSPLLRHYVQVFRCFFASEATVTSADNADTVIDNQFYFDSAMLEKMLKHVVGFSCDPHVGKNIACVIRATLMGSAMLKDALFWKLFSMVQQFVKAAILWEKFLALEAPDVVIHEMEAECLKLANFLPPHCINSPIYPKALFEGMSEYVTNVGSIRTKPAQDPRNTNKRIVEITLPEKKLSSKEKDIFKAQLRLFLLVLSSVRGSSDLRTAEQAGLDRFFLSLLWMIRFNCALDEGSFLAVLSFFFKGTPNIFCLRCDSGFKGFQLSKTALSLSPRNIEHDIKKVLSRERCERVCPIALFFLGALFSVGTVFLVISIISNELPAFFSDDLSVADFFKKFLVVLISLLMLLILSVGGIALIKLGVKCASRHNRIAVLFKGILLVVEQSRENRGDLEVGGRSRVAHSIWSSGSTELKESFLGSNPVPYHL